MRSTLILALVLLAASAASAQPNRLPRFEDYPAGPVYRGRVAPLVESSSPTARTYRTATREDMAGGINFAGHYVIATFGCGTECVSGHIVDARTGRSIADLPFNLPYTEFHPTSRLITVMPPSDILGMYPPDESGSISTRYQSSYWVLEGDSLRHLGSLVSSDIELVRRGGPMHALRQATPGDVLVPLAVGNSWTYATPGGSVTYRVTGPDPQEYSTGMLVERVDRGRGGERRAVEVWSLSTGDSAVGSGGLSVRTAGNAYSSFEYSFGVPEVQDGDRTERATVRVGAAPHEAVCYIDEVGQYDEPGTRARRTCFVPRIGMVSDERNGETLTLTAHTLR